MSANIQHPVLYHSPVYSVLSKMNNPMTVNLSSNVSLWQTIPNIPVASGCANRCWHTHRLPA